MPPERPHHHLRLWSISGLPRPCLSQLNMHSRFERVSRRLWQLFRLGPGKRRTSLAHRAGGRLSGADLVWVETPLNPTGEARDIKFYADLGMNMRDLNSQCGVVVLDATPPSRLQNPLLWSGRDIIEC